MNRGKARKLREIIEQASASLPDESALEGVELFPAWEAGRACVSGERLRYHGELYRVLQDHTAQADWTPDAAHSLFVRVAEPGEIPEWKQPTGAQDAYNLGDRVRYPDAGGDVWVSTVDNNVWEPGVYGWEKEV